MRILAHTRMGRPIVVGTYYSTERNACSAKYLFYGTSAWMAQQHLSTMFHLSETICMTYLMQWLVNWRICMAIHGV